MVNLVQPVKPTIAFSHLGCEKNRVDTEHMLGLLVQAGYQVDSNEELADYVIVNTCSFIEDARRESVRTLVGKLMENGLKIEGQSGYRETKSNVRTESRSNRRSSKSQAKAPQTETEKPSARKRF